MTRLLRRICAGDGGRFPRTLVVAAHPDDETIGAGIVVSRLRDCVVAHVTDGAPRDPRFVPLASVSREEYARRRRAEVVSALALAGVTGGRILPLGAVDQEAIEMVPTLVERLDTVIDAWRPALVVTHPYEGGHPDHDATALVVALTVRLRRRRRLPTPLVAEMTSYHDDGGRLCSGGFLRAGRRSRGAVETRLSADEQALKRRMLACFTTQAETLALFGVVTERLRMAPRYDFRLPPHPGPLLYERLGWPMSGEEWRRMAAGSLGALGCG